MSVIRNCPRRAWLILAATALLVALAVAPGAWGVAYGQTAGSTTPPAPVIQVVPATGGTIVTNPGSGGATVTLTVPAGALPGSATITASPPVVVNPSALPPTIPPPPLAAAGSRNVIAALFELEAVDSDTGQPVGTFGAPVTITVGVPPEVLAMLNSDDETITLARIEPGSNEWEMLTGCTLAGSTLTCTTTQFSIWAFVVTERDVATTGAGAADGSQQPAPRPPNTGHGVTSAVEESAGGSSTVLTLALAVGALALGTIGGNALLRRRTR